MSLSFRNEDDLLHYLTTSRPGCQILRAAVSGSSGRWLVEEILQHSRSVHVLVKAYRDDYVEVYGEPGVCAKIVFLGRSVTVPEHEQAREHCVDESLPWPYREINWPNCLVANGLRDVDGTLGAHEANLEEKA